MPRRSARAAVPVSVATASRQDVPIYLTGLGTVQALFTVGIHAQVDGKLQGGALQGRPARQKGDVLAKIDPRLYQAALDQAKAQKAQDEATLDRRGQGPRPLPDAGARRTSKPSRTSTCNRPRSIRPRRRSPPTMRPSRPRKPISTTPTSWRPNDGRMGVRMVDPGNIVHANDQGAIAILTQTEPITVMFTLPARTLDDVRDAMARGAVEVAAYDRDNTRLLSTGTLTTIDNLIDQTTATFRLKAMFPNDDEKLWPGEFVNARLLVDTRKDVVVIPPVAVQRGPHGLFAWIVKPDNTVEPRPIQIGATTGDRTIVDVRRQRRRARRHRRPVQAADQFRRSPSPRRPLRRRRRKCVVNISEPFIRRPVATTLLMAALAFVGIVSFPFLPVAPLPQVDFPTIQVTTTWPGASAETMATSVAAPLERQFGQIAGITQMTSQSALGATTIVIQFDLNRNIDSAAQDVQAAITVASKKLPQALTTPPTYKKVNPADVPILMLSVHSDTMPLITVDELRRRLPRPADLAGARRRAGLGVRRPHAVDPRPGRSGQARRERPHARGDPRHAGRLDHQRRQGHDQHRQDQLHHRRQRSDHRRREVQRRRPGLPQRRADPGARRRPGGVRAGRPHRRRLPEQPRRRHPCGIQAARRQRHRHRRPDQGAAAAARPRAFRRRSRSRPFSTAPSPSAPRWTTSSSRWCSPSAWW